MTALAHCDRESVLRRIGALLGIVRERDDQGRRRKGDWAQSYTGTKYWPLDPRADEIKLDDVVIGIARAYRYRGHTQDAISVAEHSVLVSVYAQQIAESHNARHAFGLPVDGPRADPRECARYGLIHDATEAYLGDVTRPLKRQRIMRGFRKLEAKWEKVIRQHFAIRPTAGVIAIVEEADDRVVLDEINQQATDPEMWPRSGRYVGMKPLGATVTGLPWQVAADLWCQRYMELWPGVQRELLACAFATGSAGSCSLAT